jgi:hypothetical protein
MNTPQHDQIGRALAREAEQFHHRGGTELEIGQVLARAGEIRRGRRMRATMLMAACVLAIAAPVGIISLDHDPARREPTPARQVVDRSPLTLTGLRSGDQPGTGFVAGGRFTSPDGSVSLAAAGRQVVAAAPVEGGVLVATRDEGGDLTARFVDDQGGTTQVTWPMSGSFAVSPGGNVAAFAEPDGTVMAVQDGGSRYFSLGKVPAGTGFDAIAVTGENCSGRSEGDTCAVYVATKGEKPATWAARPHATPSQLTRPGALFVSAVGPDGLVAWMTSVTDTGSCSAVHGQGEESLWSTCDHRLLSFSPDGRHVLASAAYADGMGDTQLAILDARTGKPTLELKVADGGAITQMVWEDDSHVLATVFEGGRWGVVRVGLDGRRELAVAAEPDSGDLVSPFVLPSA